MRAPPLRAAVAERLVAHVRLGYRRLDRLVVPARGSALRRGELTSCRRPLAAVLLPCTCVQPTQG